MKKDVIACLIRWILLLQEFDLEIHDKKGAEDIVADHLSRLVVKSSSDLLPVLEIFPDEQLMSISHSTVPWYADLMNLHLTEQMPGSWSKQERLHFLARVRLFFLDEPYLFKYCFDQIIRCCVPDSEFRNILSFCHDQAYGGYFSGKKTKQKFYSVIFIDPLCFVTLMSIVNLVIVVNN